MTTTPPRQELQLPAMGTNLPNESGRGRAMDAASGIYVSLALDFPFRNWLGGAIGSDFPSTSLGAIFAGISIWTKTSILLTTHGQYTSEELSKQRPVSRRLKCNRREYRRAI
jgi:hypothetical protein